MFESLITGIIRIVIAVGSAYVVSVVIPWLKDKGLYTSVKICVQAAEKLAETGGIDKAKKKQYVINALTSMGVSVSPTVETMIEAAVEELDIQKNKIVSEIKKDE